MGLDLRDVLRADMRLHPRVAQQSLFGRPEDRQRLAATLPPLVPFGNSQYAGADWILDWDHRLPSRQAVLRLFAFYSTQRRQEFLDGHDARQREIASQDLFPEFDVPDFVNLPADEVYETEMDLKGSPARLRLVSEWRREIDPAQGSRAVEIVRHSEPFKTLKGQSKIRAPGLGDLEPAEWSPPCESGHVRWGIDVWFLLTFNGMVGEGRAFLVDLEDRSLVRERDFQFRAG